MDAQGISLSTTFSVDVRGVLFINVKMLDCLASYQCSTGMNKKANGGTNPVPG